MTLPLADNPEVTVLMSVYNGARYLCPAIDGILTQTFTDFEFIIVDDGSTDETWDIVSSYTDSRIRLARNAHNLGLAASLNKGLALARGHYIARMDADDIALPERLERQVDFLNEHPEIGVVGTASQTMDIDGNPIGEVQMPGSDLHLRWLLLLGSPFIHATVMLRSEVLKKHSLHYVPETEPSEDYNFFSRLLKYTPGTNLPEQLYIIRLGSGVTTSRRELQLRKHDDNSWHIIREELDFSTITLAQVSQLRALFVGGEPFVEGPPLNKAQLIALYLDLWERFAARHATDLELPALRQAETTMLAQRLRTGVRPVARLRLWARLLRINPALGDWLRYRSLERLGYYRLGSHLRRMGLRREHELK